MAYSFNPFGNMAMIPGAFRNWMYGARKLDEAQKNSGAWGQLKEMGSALGYAGSAAGEAANRWLFGPSANQPGPASQSAPVPQATPSVAAIPNVADQTKQFDDYSRYITDPMGVAPDAFGRPPVSNIGPTVASAPRAPAAPAPAVAPPAPATAPAVAPSAPAQDPMAVARANYQETLRQHRLNMGVGGRGNARTDDEARRYYANAARHQGTMQNRAAANRRLEEYANADVARKAASEEAAKDRESRETVARESGVGAAGATAAGAVGSEVVRRMGAADVARINSEAQVAIRKATNEAELVTAYGNLAKSMQGMSVADKMKIAARLAPEIDKMEAKLGGKGVASANLLKQVFGGDGSASPFDSNAMAILEKIDDPRVQAIVAAWRSKNATPTS